MSNNSSQNSVINQSLAGRYKFDIKALFTRAWALSKHNILTILSGLFIMVVSVLGIIALVLSWFSITDPTQVNEMVQLFTSILATLVTAPILTGILMISAKDAREGGSAFPDIFNYVKLSVILGIAVLMYSLLVQLGLYLLILPGVYVKIATGFTLFLIADKGLQPLQAIILSFKMVNTYWRDFINLYLIVALMFVGGVLTFGIGLFFAIPMYYNVKGLLYHDLFVGSDDSQAIDSAPKIEDSKFNA